MTCWGLAFFAAGISGCTRKDIPAYVPISGTVTLNGETLTDGEVVFTPVKDSEGKISGRIARGIIESNGTFKMRTSPSVPGVTHGEYAISLVVVERDPAVESGPSGNPVQRPSPERNVKPKHATIPEKYLSPTTSGIRETVDASHSGRTDIVLED
jgi:hypothetical protein